MGQAKLDYRRSVYVQECISVYVCVRVYVIEMQIDGLEWFGLDGVDSSR